MDTVEIDKNIFLRFDTFDLHVYDHIFSIRGLNLCVIEHAFLNIIYVYASRKDCLRFYTCSFEGHIGSALWNEPLIRGHGYHNFSRYILAYHSYV